MQTIIGEKGRGYNIRPIKQEWKDLNKALFKLRKCNKHLDLLNVLFENLWHKHFMSQDVFSLMVFILVFL